MKNQVLFDRINHFHMLVRIKEGVVYKYSNADRSIDADRFQLTTDLTAFGEPGRVDISKENTPV